MVVKKKKKKLVTGTKTSAPAVVTDPPKKLKQVGEASKSAPVAEKKTVTPVVVDDKALTVAGVGKLTAKGALAQAQTLYKGVEHSLVTWAAVLYEIREKEYYKELEYNTYKEYVEGEFKVCVRNAQNKVGVYKTLCLENSVTPAILEKIGHTKALLISKAVEKGVLDKKKLPSLLETAETVTESELKSVITGGRKPAKEKDAGEENDPKTLSGDKGKQSAWDFTTRITGKDAIEIVRQAKEKMDAAEGKEVSQAVFLERMAMEYLASTIHKSNNSIEYYCRLLKEAYPDRHIIAVHKKHADKFAELSRSLMKKPETEKGTTGAVAKKMKKKGVSNAEKAPVKVKKEK